MDVLASLEQYQRRIESGFDRTERDPLGVAVEVLREYFVEEASPRSLESLTTAEFEEFFVDWYLRQPEADPESAETLLEAVRGWLEWCDRGCGLHESELFGPLYERLSEDLPRVLEACGIIAEAVAHSGREEDAALGLGSLHAAESFGVSAGVDRIVRLDEIDYGAAREEYFWSESLKGDAVMLQTPLGAGLGEEPIGPVLLPMGAAGLLRAGDVLHVEVAPSVSGWRILEIDRVLPSGYEPTRSYCGLGSDRSDNC